MELEIISKKYGLQIVSFDDEDAYLIKQYKWCVHGKNGKLYAICCQYLGKKKYGKIGNKITRMHRLVLNIYDSDVEVDHRDNNGLNNMKSNLRIATHQQNMCNKPIRRKSKTGMKGIHWLIKNKKWAVSISHNGSVINGGYFTSLRDAAIKYNELAIKYHGDFAYLNSIPNE